MSTASLYVEPEMSLERAIQVTEEALGRDSHFAVFTGIGGETETILPLRQAVVRLLHAAETRHAGSCFRSGELACEVCPECNPGEP